MSKIKLIGGALHNKEMEIIGGDKINVPIFPNSRTPKQKAHVINILVYKKVKAGVYRISEGYYEQAQDSFYTEVEKALDYMDEWKRELDSAFTLEMFYAVFPQFSSRESKIIFDLWKSNNTEK